MITFAKKEDVSTLKRIWKEVFHDQDWYLDLFFESYFQEDQSTLVYKTDGVIVSMLFMLPFRMRVHKSEETDVLYFYALATLPEHRGKQLMKQLMNQAIIVAKMRKVAFVILIPASDSLFGYYQKAGFVNFSNKYTVLLQKEEERKAVPTIEKYEVPSSELEKVCQDVLSQQERETLSGLLFSRKDIRFYLKTLLREDGGIYELRLHEKKDYIFYSKEQETLRILFSTLSFRKLQPICLALSEGFHQIKIENIKGLFDNPIPHTMIKGIDEAWNKDTTEFEPLWALPM